MDQAESLREIFEKQASKKKLEDCQEQVRQAIRTGDNTDIDVLMMQLERAHIEFEATLNSYS